MHDLFAVQRIIEEAKKHGEIKEISIEMGELCDLHDHDIKGRIEELTGWIVNFTIKPSNIKCGCGYKGEPKIIEKNHENVLYTCPRCENKPKVIEGDELILTEVKIK